MMSSTVVLRLAPAPSPAAGRMMSIQVSITYKHQYAFYTEMVLTLESGLDCGICDTVAVLFKKKNDISTDLRADWRDKWYSIKCL